MRLSAGPAWLDTRSVRGPYGAMVGARTRIVKVPTLARSSAA